LVSLAVQNLYEPRDDTTSHSFFQKKHLTAGMATNSGENPKPDGAAFDDFFDSIGKKAEHLMIDERNGKKDPATNGTASLNTAIKDEEEDANEPKIVDEIESLCMNCHENV
jgi:zinc finger protein